ncbi:MAG: MBL fold metallo-hydrolase [Candidatus Lokiarchaeota archaeon]|nr:MBL fold metallo-hydrolase [Candidatus Lokiarchaeota archaeon]
MEDFIIPLSSEFDGIYFIEGFQHARYPYSHSMLIGDYLIDTGISHKRLKTLKKRFPINNVLFTHWHEDHISGNYLLKDAKFYCHLKDRIPIENVDEMIRLYNVKNTPVEDELNSLIKLLRMQNIKVDALIEDNDIFNINDQLKLKVLFTPGHTAGHCAYYEQNSKIAFLGDIDLSKYPYYGNLDASLIEFEESIARIKSLDIKIVATGHRGIIEGKKKINEEIEKYMSILLERDERILAFFSERSRPIELDDLREHNIIYRKYTAFKDFEIIAELLMIEKHLEKFLKERLIIEKKNGYVLN